MKPKKSSWRRAAALLAVLLVLATGVPGFAQTGPATMNFQGRLLDSAGEPRGGVTHCMRFRLCSNDDCSTQVWPYLVFEEQVVTTEAGAYTAGLFTVALGAVEPIPPELMFDHDTLYLEIGVADQDRCPGESYVTMRPPSQLRTNAYAQRSRRVHTVESDDDFLVSVSNTGQGGGVYARTQSSTFETAAGFFEVAADAGRTAAVHAASFSSWDDSVGVLVGVGKNGGRSYGVYAVDSSTSDGSAAGFFDDRGGSGKTYGVYGKTNSADGYGIFGTGPKIGVRGVGETATATSPGVDVGVWGDSATGDGVLGVTGSSADQYAGVRGLASATSGATYGVMGSNQSSSDGAAGVFGYALASSGATHGVRGEALSTLGTGVYGRGGHYGVYGEGTAPTGASYGVAGFSAGAHGVGVLGQSESQEGVRGDSTNGSGVSGETGSTSAYGVMGLGPRVGVKGVGGGATTLSPSENVGVWGSSATGAGVWGTTSSTAAYTSGVFGWASGSTGETYGVWGISDSVDDGARGVYGEADATSGKTYGVYGESYSNSGTGVHGYASASTGLTYGISGEINSTGANAAAGNFRAKGISGQTYGVYAENESAGDNAAAGYFWAKGASGLTSGVYGVTSSSSDIAAGGRFTAAGATGQTYGVFAMNGSADDGAVGVLAFANNSEGMAVALQARSAGSGDIIQGYGHEDHDLEFQVTNYGEVYADGTYTTPAADLAEMLPAAPGLAPGDVLAIGPDGALVRSSQAYQSSVAGVYSTQPGFLGGAGDDAGLAGKAPLAIAGVVPVKVCAENGAIRPGDLLAASSLPGHAMRAEPVEIGGVSLYRPGTLIGKALEGWEAAERVGVILVLVTLQ